MCQFCGRRELIMKYLGCIILLIACTVVNNVVFADVEQNKNLKLEQLRINLKQVTKLKSRTSKYSIQHYPLRVYGQVIISSNDDILGFIDQDSHKTLWVSSALTMQVSKIIQPIKEKNFYLIFFDGKAGFYNLDTNVYKLFPGTFSGIEDIDNDGHPEILTVKKERQNGSENFFIRTYKIINVDTQPGMSLLAKNIQPDFRYEDDCEVGSYFSHGKEYIKIPRVQYYKDKDIVIIEKCGYSPCKYPGQYLQQWNKGGVQIKSTMLRKNSMRVARAERYIKDLQLSTLDKMELLNSGFNKHGRCFVFDPKCEEIKHHQKELLNNGWYLLPNLLVCSRGKGFEKLSNGMLAIFDFDEIRGDVNITKGKLFNKDVVFLSSYRKYLIIYDLQTNQPNLFFWKDILGYEPFFVKYFDGKNLVVVDNQNNILVYDVTFTYSNVKQETW